MTRSRELAELASAYDSGGSLGFRNRIINGDMRIDQRNNGAAVSVVSGASAFPVDRVAVYNGNAGATITAQRVTGSGQFTNALRVTGAAGNIGVSIYQRIESFNVSDLVGGQITISLLLSASANRTITWGVSSANSQDNFATQTAVASGSFSVTTTPTLFTATFSATSAVANGVELVLQTGVLGASQTVTLTGVQLEAGTVATPFERRDYGRELMMCQRYFEVVTYSASGFALFSAPLDSFSNQWCTFSYKVKKRAAATSALVSGAWSPAVPTEIPGIDECQFTRGGFFYLSGTPGGTAASFSAEL